MSASSKAISLEQEDHRVRCENCSLYSICLPRHADTSQLEKMDAAIIRRAPGSRGQHLYRSGDRFTSIYAVRSGAVKSYRIDANGNEQVCGFHLPGELIGLDAIVDGKAVSNARLLDTAGICEIRYDRLEELMPGMSRLQHELTRLMSREIVNSQWQLGLVANRKADERLAAFLCHLSERLRQRGYSCSEFVLPMSRRDMGNYLGLTIETVSRLFTRLQKQGLVSVKGKSVKLLDIEGLRQRAGIDALH